MEMRNDNLGQWEINTKVNGKMIKEPVMGNLPIKMVKLNKVDLMKKISTLVNNKTSLNTPN